MKTTSWLAMSFSAMLIFTGCKKDKETEPTQSASATYQNTGNIQNAIPDKYIVVYKATGSQNARLGGVVNYEDRVSALKTHTEETFSKYGISKDAVERLYVSSFQGFLAKLSATELEKIKADPNVESVEQDQVFSLGVSPSIKTTATGQALPWGISRVGYGSGVGKTAWIIDTGVDFTHPDLTTDQSRSKSFLGGTTTPQDQHGHGTHVAGTIGAINNSIGVVGVAAGATIVAMRALDASGSGTTSGIIAAVDWVASHAAVNDAVNMSIGGGASPSLDKAVTNAAQKGILFSVAAGNSAANASTSSPARVNATNVYTISAMDSNDNWASFSNYGSSVDYCAPGVNVLSTYPGGYAIMSGTSMATPHVTGLLLLDGKNIQTSGHVKNDPDGTPDPIAHK